MGNNLFQSRSLIIYVHIGLSFGAHLPALDPESDNRSSSDSPINIGESVKIICAGISKCLGFVSKATLHHEVDEVKEDEKCYTILSSHEDCESYHSVDTKHQKD